MRESLAIPPKVSPSLLKEAQLEREGVRAVAEKFCAISKGETRGCVLLTFSSQSILIPLVIKNINAL